MSPEVTIAILTHNRSWHFAQCIASIRQFTEAPYIVKVIDVKSDLDHIEHNKQFAGPDCEFTYSDDFLSCLEGRRELLKHVDTEFMVYLDDDIRVGPKWLQGLLRPMRRDSEAGASVCNIVKEGEKATSGTRGLVQNGKAIEVLERIAGYDGTADLCLGGATMYRTDVINQTEFRTEFNGGYEDWDQTLQITQTLGKKIYGTKGTVFHYHMPECKDYYSSRWRWREVIDSAVGIWDYWKIRTAIDKVMIHFLQNGIAVPPDVCPKIVEAITP